MEAEDHPTDLTEFGRRFQTDDGLSCLSGETSVAERFSMSEM